MLMHIDGNHPLLQLVLKATFPEYNGRKFKVETAETHDVRSEWSGGSRDYYAIAQVQPDGSVKSISIPSMGAFDPQYKNADCLPLDAMPNMILVRHTFFCGKDFGITFIVHPNMMNKGMLPAGPTNDLTDDEKKVLYYTRAYKSSYAGIKNYRQHESGMSPEAWEAAKALLIGKGLLDKRGALTPAGKNAASDLRY